MSERFGERVRSALRAKGPLCVGIDPHAALLAAWGLTDDAQGVREFGLRTVEAAAGKVAVVKPQVSFFERFGSRGIAALEDVLAAARAAGLIVIADAKRGDIGSTMDDYARAWLTPGSPLEADALTVSPFLGVGALDGTFAVARRTERACSCWRRPATPRRKGCSGPRTPTASRCRQRSSPRSLRATPSRLPRGEWGSFGFVIGATVDWTQGRYRAFHAGQHRSSLPVSVHREPRRLISARASGTMSAAVIASESRSILSAGPADLMEVISARAAEYREVAGV